jgi:S-adenosylmethionine synthetase
MTNFLIALAVTYMITCSEPVSIKLKSNNYSRIEMLSMISNIQEQFENTHILLYGIKSRANLRSHYFRLVLILVFIA